MTETYRWARKTFFGYLSFVVYFGFFFGIFAWLFNRLIQANTIPETGAADSFLFVSFVIILAGFGLMILFMLLLPIMQILFGYLKLSSEGFEYRRWPFSTIRGRWDEVEKVQQGTLTLPRRGPMLLIPRNLKYATLLVRKNKPGKEFPMRGGVTLGSAKYYTISLSELDGWADGRLEATLRKYVPDAFETEAHDIDMRSLR